MPVKLISEPLPANQWRWVTVETDSRIVGFVCSGQRVLYLTWGDSREAVAEYLNQRICRQTDMASHQRTFDSPSLEYDSGLLVALQESLKRYFAGVAVDFHVDVDISWASAFGRSVLRKCVKIKYGKLSSYGDLSPPEKPGAARAVGRVMASNRVPILIPCHRVVSSDGGSGGYSGPGGAEVKSELIAMEQAAAMK